MKFQITVRHFGNGLEFSDVLFGRENYEDGSHKHLDEKSLNDDIKLVKGGGIIRESKFAIQDTFVKIIIHEFTEHRLELLAEHISKSLNPLESVQDLKIGREIVGKDKESILKAIKKFLEESNS